MLDLNGWEKYLPPELIQKADELSSGVQHMRSNGAAIYPAQENLFRALTLTSPEEVKVVILGQDPYHSPGQAQGLAFSVPNGFPAPPSLRNIQQELDADVGVSAENDLSKWAKQGVLLLNTVLSVEAGKANSHKDIGWQGFTDGVLQACIAMPQPIVFILWGGQAAAACAGLLINQRPNKVSFCAPHPSPLSAYRGFFGSRPFSLANHFLTSNGSEPINW